MSINQNIEVANLTQREAIIVYLKNTSDQFRLRKFGDIVYFSKKFKYCIVYVDRDHIEKEAEEISSLDFVERVEISNEDRLELTSTHLEDQLTKMAEEAEQILEKRQKENEDAFKWELFRVNMLKEIYSR